MCGIIGYKGNKNATEIVIEGLKRLEYRGYDSWGIALKNKRLDLIKEVGKIGDFSNASKLNKSKIAIGHTRWATHGKVTEENAHPHISCDKKIAVVHNGIIENFQELKKELEKKHKFISETDTEVIPHLIEENMKLGFEEAVKKTLKRLEGNYAIVVIHQDEEKVIAARKGSPLVLGVGKDEFFVASDVPAFLKHTNKVIYLDDGEIVIINQKIKIFDQHNKEVKKEVNQIDWTLEQAQKNGYAHYMLKEIYEQKETLMRAINQKEDEIKKIAEEINKGFGTFFIACGTAHHAALTASYIFSQVTKKHINVVLASEFPNYEHFLTEKTLVIPISQSGETADVLEAVKVAKQKKSKVIAIVNVTGSTLMRIADVFFKINAGPEIAVASTKAFTSQLALLTMLAYACNGKLEEGKEILKKTAEYVGEMLKKDFEDKIKELALKIREKNHIFTIGRSVNYPIALEAALKIKEVSYIHAEGFAGGELKHGTLALIEEGTPCIVFVAHDETKKEIISNAMEIKARGGYIIGVSPENNPVFDFFIKVPDNGALSPIVNIIPAQLLAYHLGLARDCDIDRCRNLAKSVTVK
jgi:glucosamine--fructose-6-phosphate aminotransferase (isomerizing)